MQYKVKVWKIGYTLLLAYWVLISINSNFIDSSTKMFYVAIAIGWSSYIALRLYILRGKKRDCLKNATGNEGRKFKLLFLFFIGLSIIYVLLSFLGLGTWFGIEGLGFERHYILRHAYFLFTIPIGYAFAIAAYEGFWHRLREEYVLYVLYIFIFVMCICSNVKISARALSIGISSLLYIRKRTGLHLVLIIMAVIVTCANQSAPILSGMVLLMVLLFPHFSANLLGKNNRIKFVLLFVLGIIVVAVAFSKLYEFAYVDVNALWRLQYWINDIRVFFKSYGIGVGYGTAYATTSLFSEIYNPKVFIRDGYTMEEALFIITQHSSLINMFYRLGALGGFSFLFLHLRILSWFRNAYQKCLQKNWEHESGYLVWAISNFLYHFVIILLNPGIESPVFFWGYLIFFGIAVGILHRIDALTKQTDLVG